MSTSPTTTTAVNTYGVAMPEPTPGMVEALTMADAGTSRADIAIALGIDTRTVGHRINDAKRRMGRGGEVGTQGGSGGRRLTPVERAVSEVERVRAAMAQVDADVKSSGAKFDPKAALASALEAADAAVKAATIARDAIDADPDATIDAAKVTHAEHAARVKAAADERRDALTVDLAVAEAKLDATRAVVDRIEAAKVAATA